jgi:hypothetical protein
LTKTSIILKNSKLNLKVISFLLNYDQKLVQSNNQMSKHEEKFSFHGNIDIFFGITIDLRKIKKDYDIEEFEINFKSSLEVWKEKKIRGVWINIPIEKSFYIKIIFEHGFEYHHCEKDYLVMTKWLPETENKLPNYGHTCLGKN